MTRPLLVSFDGSGSSDVEGPIAGHQWDFGDGATGVGATVEHTYTEPGTYTAALTVTDQGGLIDTDTVIVRALGGPSQRVQDGLIALYEFSEGQGNLVHDSSGFGPPLDLVIADSSRTDWVPSGLRLRQTTKVASVEPATKLRDAVSASDEVTLEAWVDPDNLEQNGPARIVTLSEKLVPTQPHDGTGRPQRRSRSGGGPAADLHVQHQRPTGDGDPGRFPSRPTHPPDVHTGGRRLDRGVHRRSAEGNRSGAGHARQLGRLPAGTGRRVRRTPAMARDVPARGHLRPSPEPGRGQPEPQRRSQRGRYVPQRCADHLPRDIGPGGSGTVPGRLRCQRQFGSRRHHRLDRMGLRRRRDGLGPDRLSRVHGSGGLLGDRHGHRRPRRRGGSDEFRGRPRHRSLQQRRVDPSLQRRRRPRSAGHAARPDRGPRG